MTFKRKRSDSTSSPASTSSNFSRSSVSPSPPSQFFASAMQLEVPTQAFPSPAHSWVWQPSSEAGNDSGRTMKRFRDNRPDERLIYGMCPHIPSRGVYTANNAQQNQLCEDYTTHNANNHTPRPSHLKIPRLPHPPPTNLSCKNPLSISSGIFLSPLLNHPLQPCLQLRTTTKVRVAKTVTPILCRTTA